MKRMLTVLCLIAFSCALAGCSKAPLDSAVSFDDLVGGVADLDHLADHQHGKQ